MDTDNNAVGLGVGGAGWRGLEGVKGDLCNTLNNKDIFNFKKKKEGKTSSGFLSHSEVFL